MQKILVTGGAGFIGSHTTELLLERGNHVIVLDNFSSGSSGNLPNNKNLRVVEGDIRDWNLVQELATEVDGIIHLAAQVSVPVSIREPRESFENNMTGFINIIEAARNNKVSSVVYASSAAVYGMPSERPVSEKTSCHPLSPYGLEKYCNDQYASLYTALYDMNLCGMRFFNVYGPRQDPSSQYSGVISIFASRIPNNQPITIYGDGENTRDFIYVRDVADSLLMALNKNFRGVVNVATGISITLNRLVASIEQASGKIASVTYQEPREGDIRYSEADISSLKNLGKTDFIDIDSGINLLIG